MNVDKTVNQKKHRFYQVNVIALSILMREKKNKIYKIKNLTLKYKI